MAHCFYSYGNVKLLNCTSDLDANSPSKNTDYSLKNLEDQKANILDLQNVAFNALASGLTNDCGYWDQSHAFNAAGFDRQIQYNDSGSLAGASGFCYDYNGYNVLESNGQVLPGAMCAFCSHAESGSGIYGCRSHAEGDVNCNCGHRSHVEGCRNLINMCNDLAHMEGSGNIMCPGAFLITPGHVEGYYNCVCCNSCNVHLEGCCNVICASNASHVEGCSNMICGDQAVPTHIEGFCNRGTCGSHIEGVCNYGCGTSHAEGVYTRSCCISHAEGNNTWSYHVGHAEGDSTQAGFCGGNFREDSCVAHAEGIGSGAWGVGAHSEGFETATGYCGTHAEGYRTSSLSGHAEGCFSHASAFVIYEAMGLTLANHVEGYCTCAPCNGQYLSHVEGCGNTLCSSVSHLEGMNSVVCNHYGSHIEGNSHILTPNVESCYSHIEGASHTNVMSSGNAFANHIEGCNNCIDSSSDSSSFNHIEGFNNCFCKSGFCSHVEGYLNIIGNICLSHVEGCQNYMCDACISHVEGDHNSIVCVLSAHVEGFCNVFCAGGYGMVSHVEGANNVLNCSHYVMHVEGSYHKVLCTISSIPCGTHVEGYTNRVDSTVFSHIEGANHDVEESCGTHVEGMYGTSYGCGNHVEGCCNALHGCGSHVEGAYNLFIYSNPIIGSHIEGTCHALGDNTYGGVGIHMEGCKSCVCLPNIATHIEGVSNYVCANNVAVHAEGGYNTVERNSEYSHVEGVGNWIGFNCYTPASHTEGCCNITQGIATHVEGLCNYTYGDYSHAEGFCTYNGDRYCASYLSSHTEGFCTCVFASGAHAEGCCTCTKALGSHVEGIGACLGSSAIGAHAWSGGFCSCVGDAQYERYVLTANTNGTEQELLMGGTGRIIIAPNTTKMFSITISTFAHSNYAAGWIYRGAIRNTGGSLAFAGGPTLIYSWDGLDSSATISITADFGNGSLMIKVDYPYQAYWTAVVECSSTTYY